MQLRALVVLFSILVGALLSLGVRYLLMSTATKLRCILCSIISLACWHLSCKVDHEKWLHYSILKLLRVNLAARHYNFSTFLDKTSEGGSHTWLL